jgi:hypothetical protein
VGFSGSANAFEHDIRIGLLYSRTLTVALGLRVVIEPRSSRFERARFVGVRFARPLLR